MKTSTKNINITETNGTVEIKAIPAKSHSEAPVLNEICPTDVAQGLKLLEKIPL